MDNELFSKIYDGLGAYLTTNKTSCYSASLCTTPPTSPSYPLVVFDEVRNVAVGRSYGEIRDRIASSGYQVDIYGKTRGNAHRRTVARTVAAVVDKFLSDYVGLHRMSFNTTPVEADGGLYRITMMYDKRLYENRKQLIN